MLRWLLAYLATNALVVLVGTALWAVEASVIFTGLLVGAAATHGAAPPVGALVAAFWVTGIGNGVVLTVLATLACWLVARRAEVKLRPFVAGLAGFVAYVLQLASSYARVRHTDNGAAAIDLATWPTHLGAWLTLALVLVLVLRFTRRPVAGAP